MNDEVFHDPDFRQKPRPVGFDIAYRLEGDTLVIDQTRKIERVALGAVEQVRFFFQPNSISTKGYKTELRLKDGRTITFGNLSWRSFVDLDRQEESYRRFATRVAQAVAKANPECRFIAGRSWIIWVIFGAIGFGATVGMAGFAWMAWRRGETNAALFALFMLGLAIWQIEPMVRLNRPRVLALGEVPEQLLP
jgi:hypothetical protein